MRGVRTGDLAMGSIFVHKYKYVRRHRCAVRTFYVVIIGQNTRPAIESSGFESRRRYFVLAAIASSPRYIGLITSWYALYPEASR